jgi:hypothetical protein
LALWASVSDWAKPVKEGNNRKTKKQNLKNNWPVGRQLGRKYEFFMTNDFGKFNGIYEIYLLFSEKIAEYRLKFWLVSDTEDNGLPVG